MLGNNGKPYANRAVGRADLLIVVGARIADRATALIVLLTWICNRSIMC